MSTDLKNILEKLYKKYNHTEFIPPDPLQFIYKYDAPADMEIVGFFASALAYGRVEQIQKSLTNLFSRMGQSPYKFVIDFNTSKAKKLAGFKHRFNTADDIVQICGAFKKILKKFDNLERFFIAGYSGDDENIIPALENFTAGVQGEIDNCPRGVSYLLSRPSRGSACKRLNLFLRWMVRDDNIDAGLWSSVSASKLLIPVDIHIGRLTSFLGMHEKKTMNLRTAVKITHRFAEICPDDPVKYDFCLSRIGILENCTGKYNPYCKGCELLGFCAKRLVF